MNLLIVDDSIVYRSAIRKAAQEIQGIGKIDVASNGKVGLEYVRSKNIHVITLDMEMPIMDGLEFIQEVRKINREVIIIVFASENINDVNKALKALELGANDFISKNTQAKSAEESVQIIRVELEARLNAFENQSKPRIQEKANSIINPTPSTNKKIDGLHPHALFFGSSTGGPDLWRKIFTKLGSFQPKCPIFLVQHMPPLFTKQFAGALNQMVSFDVVEAKEGDHVKAGTFYIAPGDYHMTLIKKEGKTIISLNQNEKVCYVRPAFNCLLDSAIAIYGINFITFVLTGMGEDGLDSIRILKQRGVPIIIQDQETSSVWGMPGAIAKEGLQDKIVSAEEVPILIKRFSS
jgi:two-component system chemotaxis response regulator CheB